jgi:hypothetical protein
LLIAEASGGLVLMPSAELTLVLLRAGADLFAFNVSTPSTRRCADAPGSASARWRPNRRMRLCSAPN